MGFRVWGLGLSVWVRGYYLEGRGELISRLILGIRWLITWVIRVRIEVCLLSPPDPPSMGLGFGVSGLGFRV